MSNKEHKIDPEFDKDVYTIMQTAGWLFPETPWEVEKIEKELEQNPVKLPDSISDASKVYNLMQGILNDGLSKAHSSDLANEDIRINLARAAREGSDISDDLAERMRKDRKKARDEMNGK